MRSIMWHSAKPSGGSFNGLIGGVLWLLLVAVVASAYALGKISVGTLVFAEACTLALGIIAVIFGNALIHPPEIVEQILYRTEHKGRS